MGSLEFGDFWGVVLQIHRLTEQKIKNSKLETSFQVSK